MFRLCTTTLCVLALASCARYEARPLDPAAHWSQWRERDPGAILPPALTPDTSPDAPFSADDGLTLSEAEQVALVFNPELRIARARIGVRDAFAEHAGLLPDPVLTGDVARIIDSVPNPWMGAGVLGFSIPISGRLDAARTLAGAERDEAALRAFADEWRVRIELRRAWAEWTQALAREQILDSLVARLNELVGIVDAIEQAGELARVQGRLFHIERSTRRAQLAVAHTDAARAADAVRRIMGLAPGAPIDLLPELPRATTKPFGAPETWIAPSHPDILIAEAAYESAERRLDLEVRRQYPDITIGPGFGQEEGNSRVILGLSMPIPIFNANRQAVATAHAERDLARVEYESVLERREADYADAIHALTAAQTLRISLEQDIVPLADQQYAESLRIVEFGEVDTPLLLDTLTRQHDARLALVDAALRESLAAIRIAELLGPDEPALPPTEPTP